MFSYYVSRCCHLLETKLINASVGSIHKIQLCNVHTFKFAEFTIQGNGSYEAGKLKVDLHLESNLSLTAKTTVPPTSVVKTLAPTINATTIPPSETIPPSTLPSTPVPTVNSTTIGSVTGNPPTPTPTTTSATVNVTTPTHVPEYLDGKLSTNSEPCK